MRVILLRHGMPAPQSSSWITGRELGSWIRSFDLSGIRQPAEIPRAVRDLASTVDCMLSSDLPRSVQSAAALRPSGQYYLVKPELREAPLPQTLGIPIRALAAWWIVIARFVWWLNLRDAEESVVYTQLRARGVANQLGTLAAQHGSVLVVGHGFFNSLLARALHARGWAGPRIPPSNYWSIAIYTLHSSSD